MERLPRFSLSPSLLLTAALTFGTGCLRSTVAPEPEDAGPRGDASVVAPEIAFLLQAVDERTRAPVAGAEVRLRSADGAPPRVEVTDAEGAARFMGSAAGPFTLEVEAGGYATHTLYAIPTRAWTVGLARERTTDLPGSVRSDASVGLDRLAPAGDGGIREVSLYLFDWNGRSWIGATFRPSPLGYDWSSTVAVEAPWAGFEERIIEARTVVDAPLWALWLGRSRPATPRPTFPTPAAAAARASYDRLSFLELSPLTEGVVAELPAALEVPLDERLALTIADFEEDWEDVTVRPRLVPPGGPPLPVALPVWLDAPGTVSFRVPPLDGPLAGSGLWVETTIKREYTGARPGAAYYHDLRSANAWPADGRIEVRVEPAGRTEVVDGALRVAAMDPRASVHELELRYGGAVVWRIDAVAPLPDEGLPIPGLALLPPSGLVAHIRSRVAGDGPSDEQVGDPLTSFALIGQFL
jgi:hypothetical protein